MNPHDPQIQTAETLAPDPSAGPGERRKLFSLRRSGKVALQEAVEVVGLDAETDLLGLEGDLIAYDNLWKEHNSAVRSLLDNHDISIVGDVILELQQNPTNRDARRDIARFQERDYDTLASIYITAGKLKTSIKDQTIRPYANGDTQLRQSLRGLREVSNHRGRIDAKRAGLFSNLLKTPSVEKLESFLLNLEKTSTETYRPIVKHEGRMKDRVMKLMYDDPHAAVKLLDAFLASTGSQAEVETNFGAFIANDHVNDKDSSMIAQALHTVEAMVIGDGLRGDYINDLMSQREGDNPTAFFATILRAAGVAESLETLMTRPGVEWPTEYEEGYKEYTKKLLQNYRTQIVQAVDRNINKAWLRPDLDTYEDAVDRQWKRFHGNPDKRYAKPSGGPKKNLRYTASPNDFLPKPEVERPNLVVATLKRTDQGYKIDQPDDEATVISRLVDKSMARDASFMKDLSKIIDRLKQDPRGRGVFSTKGRRGRSAAGSISGAITVDGKSSRLYKAKPAMMTGLSVGERAKDARILFTLQNGTLAILAIPKNHEDYDQILSTIH